VFESPETRDFGCSQSSEDVYCTYFRYFVSLCHFNCTDFSTKIAAIYDWVHFRFQSFIYIIHLFTRFRFSFQARSQFYHAVG
jgi:hypothetical protein